VILELDNTLKTAGFKLALHGFLTAQTVGAVRLRLFGSSASFNQIQNRFPGVPPSASGEKITAENIETKK